MKNEIIILPIKTPVAIIPYDWSDLIDRRSVFNPQYGIVIDYGQEQFFDKIHNCDRTVYLTEIMLKNGKVMRIAGFTHDGIGIFDKTGFRELIGREIEKIESVILETESEVIKTEDFVNRLSESAPFIKDFWNAQLASMRQSVKFLSKKKRKLDDLGRKVEKKLKKMEK